MFDLNFLNAMIVINRMSISSSITIMAPTESPLISPAPTDSATMGLTLCPLVSASGLEVVTFLVVVIEASVVVVISVSEEQSGSLRVSRGVLQSLSRCRRKERTLIEAVPLATQDCIRETRPEALYTAVPMIIALYMI